jgi:PDZ domain-containing secreted protein
MDQVQQEPQPQPVYDEAMSYQQANQNQQRMDPSYAKWVQDSDEILDTLEHNLRGEIKKKENVKDDLGNIKVVITWNKVGEQLMNEHGIAFVRATLSPVLSKNTFFSSVDQYEINTHGLMIAIEMTAALAKNHRNFELDLKKAQTVKSMINLALYFGMKRAEFGGEREAIGTITQEIRNILSKPEEPKKRFGFF